MDFPIWFTEAVQGRFEVVCVQSQQGDLIQKEVDRFSAMFKVYMTGLSEDVKVQFLQVEEAW